MTIIREFSPCGPCLTLGTLTKETAKFYFFRDARSGSVQTSKIMKATPEHYSRAHVEPCPSCMDHPKTQYPNGYMD